MCTLKYISQQTGISEEDLKSKRKINNISVIKALCVDCMRKEGKTYQHIANTLELCSHASAINLHNTIRHNSKHKNVIAAKRCHQCFKKDCEQDILEVEPVKTKKKKKIKTTALEERLENVSVFSKEFEQIIREINIRDIRYSHQRL